jgi:excisionase family DNA binding protein
MSPSVRDPFTNRRRVNIVQACGIAQVSRRTIYNWIRAGKLDIVRTAGGSVRIFEDTLMRNADGSPRRRR